MIECAVQRDSYFDPVIILPLPEQGHENKPTQANPVCIRLAPKYVFGAKGACSVERSLRSGATPASLCCGHGTPKDLQKFFQFFETTGGFAPYLAYEKSKPLTHNSNLCSWLLCPLFNSESIRGCSTAGWRLSRWEHRRGVPLPRKPDYRCLQYRRWRILTPKHHRREPLHRCRRGSALCQHRRPKYGHRRGSAF